MNLNFFIVNEIKNPAKIPVAAEPNIKMMKLSKT
jgi:hypothetical protein